MTHDHQQALDFLQQCPQLPKISHLDALAEHCMPVHVEKGKEVFREAQLAHDLYLLCSGSVATSTRHHGGIEIVFGKPLEPGHFFGEVGPLSLNEHLERRRTATVIAVEKVKAVKLTWNHLKEFVRQHPDNEALLDLLVMDMAERLRRSGSQLSHFKLQNPNEGLKPQGLLDGIVRKSVKHGTSLTFLLLNVFLIACWFVARFYLKTNLDSAVGWLSLIITIEALIVTTLVLNSQGKESEWQETRTARQFANTETTVRAVGAVQEQLQALRGELADARTPSAVTTSAVTGGYLPPVAPVTQQIGAPGSQEHKP